MKRLLYAVTIACVGVLTAVAVRTPATQEVSLSGGASVPHAVQYVIDSQSELKPVKPLVVKKAAPTLSLPDSGDLKLHELADSTLSHDVDRILQDIASLESKDEDLYGDAGRLSSGSLGISHMDTGEAYQRASLEEQSEAAVTGTSDNQRIDDILPIREDRKAGYVLVDEVVKRHPLWMEQVRIEREIDASKSRWQSYVDASISAEEGIAQCIDVAAHILDGQVLASRGEGLESAEYSGLLESKLALIEASLVEEAEQRVEAKRMELQAGLEDRLYAKQAELNNEFDEFRDKVVKETYLSIVNIQMKLQLLELSDDERSALEQELSGIKDEVQSRLDAKRKELDEVYAAYSGNEIAKSEELLSRFREEQASWVASELERERQRMTEELECLLDACLPANADGLSLMQEGISMRGLAELSTRREEVFQEFKAREAQFIQELEELSGRRDEIEDAIRKDIYSAVAALRDETGVTIELIDGDYEAGDLDASGVNMTSEIIRIMRNSR